MDVSPAPIRADYSGACVANVVPALFGSIDAAWLPDACRDARATVLFVLDGLGAQSLEDHAASMPTLAAMQGRRITTVSPATTSAALTSITTGSAPARHGIVGYRTLVDDVVLNVLRWAPEGGAQVRFEPHDVQRRSAFRGRPVPVVTKSEFQRSGFTRAHLGDGPFLGWKTPAVLVERCRSAVVDDGASFVYAYYPGIDEVAHEFGMRSGYYEAELRQADAIVGHLLDALPHDTALVVTADHGQCELGADDWVDTFDLNPLVRAQSGDARFRHLHARPGMARELLSECERRFSSLAWVVRRKDLLDDGWLGPNEAGPTVTGSRVGDVVLMPFGRHGFVDPALPKERNLKTAHGAPTVEEMLVPLRASRGHRPNIA